MHFCGKWADLDETDHETVYKCLIVKGRRELAQGEVIKLNGQGPASSLKNLAPVMNRTTGCMPCSLKPTVEEVVWETLCFPCCRIQPTVMSIIRFL